MEKQSVNSKTETIILTRERLREIGAEIKARECHKVENQISDEEFDRISKDVTNQGVVVIARF
jgi:hypothetical protein